MSGYADANTTLASAEPSGGSSYVSGRWDQAQRGGVCEIVRRRLEAAAGPAQALEAEVILWEILALRKIVSVMLYGPGD